MHVRLMLIALALAPLAGCLGVDNMYDLKSVLGAHEEYVAPPILAPSAKASVDSPTALVGATVRFVADGSSDPQGHALDFTWSFGDGATGTGRETTHAYTKAGTYVATLTVVNQGGVADVALVRLEVLPLDLPPHAQATARPASAWTAQTVAFSAGGSYDPEGQPIRTLWDFGDGGSSVLAEPKHAFAAPGRHTVRLEVIDAGGQSGAATILLPVSHADNRTGLLDATNTRVDLLVPVPETPTRFRALLDFEAAPANDLRLELRDASGRLLDFTTEGGTRLPGMTRVTIDLAEPQGAAGDWTLSVVRHSGVRVAYTLTVQSLYA